METLITFLLPVAALLSVAVVVLVLYFIYRFITMHDSPFLAMKAIYVYIAALIGLVVSAFGFYQIVSLMLEAVMDPRATFVFGSLASPLALLLTGLFIMVPHIAIGLHFHWFGTEAAGKRK